MRVVTVIPAHNEEKSLPETIEAMHNVAGGFIENIVVIADNCTDRTVEVASQLGAEVIETVGNTDKKAGAINFGMDILLDRPGIDYFLIVDADTALSRMFLVRAWKELHRGADAVGGVFRGSEAHNWLEVCQSNEYARYAREVERKKRVMVLSGTASLIPAWALKKLKHERVEIYRSTALTEDMEMTLALKSMGLKLASPEACGCTTELMPTVGDLVRQRVRWYRGALENLVEYGWVPLTRRYWFQQFMLSFSVFGMFLFVALSIINIVIFGISTSWFWILVTGLFWLERVWTVWHRADWTGRLLAGTLGVELFYSMILHYAFVKAVYVSLRKKEAEWSHLS